MKRFLIISFLLIAISMLYAAPSAGRIGIQADYSGYLETDEYSVNAQEAILSVTGANFFDENKMFGLGYSFGYGFTFGGLTEFNPLHLNLAAIFSFNVTPWFSIEPRIGFADTIYIFDNIVSTEFGMLLGCGFEFMPIKHLGLSLLLNYTLPIVSGYGNSYNMVAFEKHLLSCGLAVSYLY